MTLLDLRNVVHNRSLDFRALDRLIQTVEFEEAQKLDPNNERVEKALLEGDLNLVQVWIDKTLTKELGELSLRKLRDKASALGIKGYVLFTKEQLLMRVIKVLHDNRSKAEEPVERVSCPSDGQALPDFRESFAGVPSESCEGRT